MAKNDKFYTKKDVAKQCCDFLKKYIDFNKEKFIEPSAGNGAFLDFLPNFSAFDLFPENEQIKEQDFLTLDITSYQNYISIGNPPFGKKSKLAIDFFNKCSTFSKVIAFIVPVSFMKWNVQKELSNNFKLIDYFYLESNSFLDRDKDFSVRTVFQIWVKKDIFNEYRDLRLTKAPPIKHSDFNIWQYNATKQSENVVDENWEIAVYRQGYHDYNKLFFSKDKEAIREKMLGISTKGKQQFFFIQPLSEQSRNIIMNMDFNSLAERNTSTPGFGKGDFVSYYMELKNKEIKNTINIFESQDE